MLAISALSMAFWSAARLLETSFFCASCQSLPLASLPTLPDRNVSSYLGLLSLLEEGVLAGLLLGLLGGEVLRPRDLLNLGLVDAGQVDLHGCGDDVSRVDATEGDTVDLEGAGDEQDTLVEVLEEDNALAAEPTSEQDQDGTGLEGAARRPRAEGLADLRTRPTLASELQPKIVFGPETPSSPWSCDPPFFAGSSSPDPARLLLVPPLASGSPGTAVRSAHSSQPTTELKPEFHPICRPGTLAEPIISAENGMLPRTLRGLASSSAGYHF